MMLAEQVGLEAIDRWDSAETQAALCQSYSRWLGEMELVLNIRRRMVEMMTQQLATSYQKCLNIDDHIKKCLNRNRGAEINLSRKELRLIKRSMSEVSRQLEKTVAFLEEQAAALLALGESLQETAADSCNAKAEVATNRSRLSDLVGELLATVTKALADCPA